MQIVQNLTLTELFMLNNLFCQGDLFYVDISAHVSMFSLRGDKPEHNFLGPQFQNFTF